MAYIAVERNGEAGIGSAFHIGDGVFVTARHVVEGATITEMRVTDAGLYYRSDLYPKNKGGSYTIAPDSPRICTNHDGLLTVVGQPGFHPDPNVDIAVLRTSGIEPNTHFVPLGSHLDDWVGTGDFELCNVLVLGYPPIPFTREPVLVAAAGQINATVDLTVGTGQAASRQLHYVISGLPRGGFSGGLVFTEWGFALGTVTQSLMSSHQVTELGFLTTTSIEAIYVCLKENGCLPEVQKEGWDGLWDY